MAGKVLHFHKGFTMVELVVVIVVVAIISLYAASRFIGVSQFSANAAQEQGISVIRQIQLGRMQSNVDSMSLHNRHTLSVSDTCLGSVQECVDGSSMMNSHRVAIGEEGNELEMNFSPAMRVSFDLLGNPSCLQGCTTPTAGEEIQIDINSESNQKSICINSQGYVYGC